MDNMDQSLSDEVESLTDEVGVNSSSSTLDDWYYEALKDCEPPLPRSRRPGRLSVDNDILEEDFN